MIHWKRNLAFVWTAQFLCSAGFSFATPFIPFYIKAIGVTDPARASMWVALYAAAGNLSLLLAAPFWGVLSDTYGRRPMLVRASLVSGLLMPCMVLVPGVGWLVALRFAVGLFAGTVTAAQVLVSSTTPIAKRGIAIGSLCSAVYGGQMAGTFLGGLVTDKFGFRCSFFTCGAILIAAGLIVVFGVKEEFHREPSAGTATRQRRLPAFGATWLILLLVFFMGLAVRFDAPFLPLLVETIHGPERAATWTGAIASIAALTGIVSGSFLGWLADRTSPWKVAMWSAALAGALMVPQALAGRLAVLAAARTGMVFCAGGLVSVFQIWLAKSTPDASRGTLFGWATSIKSCGWFIGSLAGGVVAANLGVRWVYVCAALAFVLLAILTRAVVWLQTRRT